jgi:hypothetical protein
MIQGQLPAEELHLGVMDTKRLKILQMAAVRNPEQRETTLKQMLPEGSVVSPMLPHRGEADQRVYRDIYEHLKGDFDGAASITP